eukprot:7201420-Karenia_brevis.AAC.1
MRDGETPRLYTTESQHTALYYARHREFPCDTRCDCGVFGVQNITELKTFKTFQAVFGVASKAPFPHH